MHQGLEMKYFVLKPRSKAPGDAYALASREAMHTYAETIRDTNPRLASEIMNWVTQEEILNGRWEGKDEMAKAE